MYYKRDLFLAAPILALSLLFWAGCSAKEGAASATAGYATADSATAILADVFPGKGAALPFISYQSQDAAWQGQLLGFSTEYHTIQSEATGRMAVKLQEPGDYVEFTLREGANAMTLRYCMPDSPEGGGMEGSLTVYAGDSKIGTIRLTSKYAWLYNYARGWPGNNDPSSGEPCRFFDDSRMLFDSTLPAGTTVTLRKEDDVAYYVIDMVEFELVPAPLPRPENSLSIADFGAVADGRDCRIALINCIREARAQNKEVWIPAGDFTIGDSFNVQVNGAIIGGAGVWHSSLNGGAYFMVNGSNNYIHDFAVFGEVTERVDSSATCAFDVRPGNNNRFEDLWMEHTKCGFWVYGATNLSIKNCRIRNTIADGINLTYQTNNSIVENCDLRNLGDDGIALNSEQNRDSNNNTVKNNTVRVAYHANGIAVYGGGNHTIQDNVVYDTVAYGGGINISSRFNPTEFYGTTTVKGNVLVRTGSAASTSERGTNHGAIWLVAWEKDVSGVVFSGNRLIDCTFDGITIDGNGSSVISNIVFENNSIENARGYGIMVFAGAKGSASFRRTSISGAANGDLGNLGGFTITGIGDL